MAAAELRLDCAPDFAAQLEELEIAAQVIDAAGMLHEPECQRLLDRLHALMCSGAWCAYEQAPDGTFMVSVGDDRLLKVFSEIQALRQVARARLKGGRA
jgi:hypothetical protein